MMGDEDRHASLIMRRKKAPARITVQAARGENAAAVEHLRTLLRWRPLVSDTRIDYNREDALRAADAGLDEYRKYMQRVEGRTSEVLPKMLVHDVCPELIRCLSSAVRDDKHPDQVKITPGMEPVQSLLFGAMAHREGAENRQPLEVFTAQRLESATARGVEDPMSRYIVAKKAEADWGKKQPKPFTLNRIGRKR
jgi:hypothetical protein